MNVKSKLMVLAISIILLLAAGCSDAIPVTDNNPVRTGEPSNKPSEPGKNAAQETMRITVYHATKDAMNLVGETHVVDKNDNPAKTAISFLMAQPTDKNLIRVLPSNARLLSLKVQNGIAYANFSQQLARNSGGSANEVLIVAAIVNTLTEFPEIKAVQILVEGKKVESLSGHMDISEPLSRSEGIIKRERKQ